MSAKVPAAEPVARVTLSLPTTPTSEALPVFSVAVILPLYILLSAVTPVTVNVLAVIFAVVVGCVS